MTIFHNIQRSRQLGFLGTIRHIWKRSINNLNVWSQSLWWGWMARREMSDSALLSHTTGSWTSVEALLDHLAGRPAESFLLPHESPQETAKLINHLYPEYVSALFGAADAACRNELSLLSQKFTFPNGIDWQCDPVTGWRWPLWHRIRIGKYLYSPARRVDLIRFWELNRHQHFITLGIAYWLTGDEKYAEAFSSQVRSWIETNPLQHGVNWYYPLEVSIRLLAWTVAFQFFRGSSEFRQSTGTAFLKSFWQQADFLNSHLQTTRTRNDVPNNHMIAELTGLVLIGAAFPEFREAAGWRDTAVHLLTQQAAAQTHPDGVNKEQATGYHRFVSELLLLVVVRSRQGGLPDVPILENILQSMLDYMVFTLSPVGTGPLWGDSDYGRALGIGLNKDFWDFRPILSAGAVLFDRPEWKFSSDRFDEESFLLLGTKGLKAWEQLDTQPPKQTSRAFPNAGLYVIRDAWTTNTDAAFFRCGPFGLGGEGHCAHAHCDLLSFDLWVKGQPLLIDSGTYMYYGPLRDYFRLTAAHNTVMIDGIEQAKPMPFFNWQDITEPRYVDWNAEHIRASLTYSDRVTFTRELAHPEPGIWELVDKFVGHGEHKLQWFFHFAPGLDLLLHGGRQTLSVLKGGNLFVTLHLPDNGIFYELRDSWCSYYYGIKKSNRVIHANWRGKLEDEPVSFHWQFASRAKDSLAEDTFGEITR